jgi:hypothetical protein
MSNESLDRSAGSDCAGEALATIHACSGELQTYVAGVFDQLERLTDEWLGREIAWQQAQRQAERESLQGQMDQLTVVTDQLTQAVAEQKKLAGRKHRHGQDTSRDSHQ